MPLIPISSQAQARQAGAVAKVGSGSDRCLADKLLQAFRIQPTAPVGGSLGGADWFRWAFGDTAASTSPGAPVPAAYETLACESTQGQPPTPQQQVEAVGAALRFPVMGIGVRLLSGPEPQAGLHAAHPVVLVRSIAGQPMSFEVHSGDVFAAYLASTTPGLVRLISVDGSTSAVLETLSVRPGAVNRFPRQGAGGIVVDDNVGSETLRVEFEPCLPEALQGEPTLRPFLGKLGRCHRLMGPSAGASASSRLDGQGSVGQSLPAPAGEFAGTGLVATDQHYRPGEVIRHDITIHHKPRRH